jgi:inorganic pyrophosphatase
MSISRPLPSGLAYPFDWGFVSSTRAPDGDPLDAMIFWDIASHPGVVIPCRMIGVLKVEQSSVRSRRRERNDRLFVIPVKAARQEEIRSALDLGKRRLVEIEKFFVAAVALEHKNLKLLGWAGPAEAGRIARAAAAAFAQS